MIRVNNRDQVEWSEGMTVSDLLDRLNFTFPHIIVSVNGDIVDKADYPTYEIPDEADVRVIHLIAGG